MTKFVLEELETPLAQAGLLIPMRATKFGIIQSHFHFFSILEKYSPETCTFFTPVEELGFALHEMHEVSGLILGDLPYEEFVPGSTELKLLKKTSPEIYATLWEVMCHFHICMQLTGARGSGIKQVSWAEYLFQNLTTKGGSVTRLPVKFESFHYQALIPISNAALLAGFLMLWLKRCVVPTRPVDALAIEVVYPAVLLAHGRPVSLLSAMVGCLQYGLR
uniref:Aminotransferase-like plant mobile domain-containing protein n=1 Tax=Asparagus officinalis TaxID=4686 RepID=Q2AA24_ASPOF|nr:hypothetical protein 20.t00049 [Asparagus officinalis]